MAQIHRFIRKGLFLGGWMIIAVCNLLGAASVAQTAAAPQSTDVAASRMAFEVVAIKPDKSESGRLIFTNTPDGFEATGFTAQMLIRAAYGYDDDRISGGPKWLNSDRYEIKAKIAESDVPALARLGPDQRNQMLQPVLTDRFQLLFHRELRQLPVYALVVSKNGPRLKPSPTAGPGEKSDPQMRMATAGQLTGKRFPISLLVQWLSLHVGRPVLDQTNLTDVYDFTLQWAPDLGASHASGGGQESAADSAASIFTALQEQLGLKLEPTKGPVETLVIDRVQRPSEN
jgi:uncharacterized protein (TIGR03435 family)